MEDRATWRAEGYDGDVEKSNESVSTSCDRIGKRKGKGPWSLTPNHTGLSQQEVYTLIANWPHMSRQPPLCTKPWSLLTVLHRTADSPLCSPSTTTLFSRGHNYRCPPSTLTSHTPRLVHVDRHHLALAVVPVLKLEAMVQGRTRRSYTDSAHQTPVVHERLVIKLPRLESAARAISCVRRAAGQSRGHPVVSRTQMVYRSQV